MSSYMFNMHRPLSLVPASTLLVFVRPVRPPPLLLFRRSLFFSLFSVFRLPSNASLLLREFGSLVFALSLVFGDGGQCVGGAFCSSWLVDWSVGRSVGLGQGLWVNSLGDSILISMFRNVCVLSTRFEYL